MAHEKNPSPEQPETTPSEENHAADDEGVSLEKLSAAFAELIAPDEEIPTEELDLDTEDAEGDGEEEWEEAEEIEEEVPLTPAGIVEAVLFVGNERGKPIPREEIAAVIRDVEPEEIDELVAELNAVYDQEETPYAIVAEKGGYRLTLREAFYPIRNRFYGRMREARLSQAAIDVLAIVAYNQPLTSEQISKIRGGTQSGHLLTQLVRRDLLRIERKSEPKRTVLYYVTDRFLRLFGLDRLEDLPKAHDLEPR